MTFFVRYREKDTAGRLITDKVQFFNVAGEALHHFQELTNEGFPIAREYRLEIGELAGIRSSGRGTFDET